MKTFNKVLAILVLAVFGLGAATTTSTTTTAALTSGQGAASTVCLTSSTGVAAPGFGNPALTGFMIDKEFMVVNAATPNANCWITTRGFAGTKVTAHASGATVWVGPTGGLNGSPFINNPPVAGTPCVSTSENYLPLIVVGGEGFQNQIGWIYNCSAIASGVSLNIWTAVQSPVAGGALGMVFYGADDAGANNAITASIPGLPQTWGACVNIKLAHTLQAGANTFALNGATAVAIKSHYNQATDIGTAYAATGTANLCYNGTAWLDMSE